MYFKSTTAALSLVTLLLLFSCNSSEPVKGIYFGGTIAQKSGDQLVLYRIDTFNFQSIDSVKPHGAGEFSFFLETDITGFYFLGHGSYFTPAFAAFPGDSIKFEISKNHTNDVHGGREAEVFAGFMHSFADGELQMVSLLENLLKARYTGDYALARSETDATLKLIAGRLKEQALSFIHANPGFLSNILIMNASPGGAMLFDESIDYSLFFEVDSLLQVHHPENSHTAFFHQRVSQLRARVEAKYRTKELLGSGVMVPNIVLPGTSDKPTGLYEKKGKLTLIYFWSPSESQSRQSNVLLKKLYEKYKSEGFPVFAVSFDADVDRFKSVVKLDKLWWDNVNDTLGKGSTVLKSYAIDAFPSFVLIDRQGKVVEVFLSAEALNTWMEHNFK
jgi:peroxiredoxin